MLEKKEVVIMGKINQIKQAILKAVAKSAMKTAQKSANTACDFWQHQSVLPRAVKKMRKF